MRWNHKIHSEGDRRTVKRFALLPKQCNKGHLHWLEYMYVEEIYLSDFGWIDWDYHICNVVEDDK